MGSYRDLGVYRRSCVLADHLHNQLQFWSPMDQWTVGKQMINAADSIGANIAEAYGRDTLRDRRRQVYVARGSCFELEHWLDRANVRGLPLPDGAGEEVRELGRMLNGLARHYTERLTPDT
jgi:four helix bundle protein